MKIKLVGTKKIYSNNILFIELTTAKLRGYADKTET